MEFSGLARQISLISRATPSLQRISIVPRRASPIAHAQSMPPSPNWSLAMPPGSRPARQDQ